MTWPTSSQPPPPAAMLPAWLKVAAPSCRRQDVQDEHERVGALNAGLRVALRAVALGRRHHEHDPASDRYPDQAGVPGRDEPTEREHVRRNCRLSGGRPVAVKHLAVTPDRSDVPDHNGLLGL